MTNDGINSNAENSTANEAPATEQQETTAQTETAANANAQMQETAATEYAATAQESETANDTPQSAATASADAQQTQTASASQPGETQSATAASNGGGGEQAGSKEMDFGAILQQFEQEQTIYHAGELVEGKVVGISDRGVLIDFGYKSEGVVPVEEFTGADGEVSVKQGDTVEVVIRAIHSGDAPPMLSRQDATSRKAWAEIEQAFNEERPITGRVIDKTKGGLRVDLNGVEAFLPGSQIDSRPIRNLDGYIGQDIESKIIKFSRKKNNIVLSRKVITDEVVNAQKAETMGQIEEGYIVDGTIKNLTEYGAFVDIGGIDGLLHVTDMSWNRLMNPNQMFKSGDAVQVKILKLDREREKVSLGYKQLHADPWSTVTEVYPVNSKLKGKVSSVTDYGAFIELEPGVEGLVHVSEMSWSKRSKSPRKLLNAGEEVDVQVLGIDTNERRISLGMKQLQENPWDTVLSRYKIGQTVQGRVRNLTDFGAFVEIEEGVDGLVHVSDISHSKKIKHPKDVLRRDQEVEAVITSIDTRGRRMSLSIKDMTPSEWERFITNHKPGDVVRGKISRFAGFGVFVQLDDDLEGLCHISELSDERVERPEDVVQIGQEMDFKILRIEHEDRKIGLSARAVGKGEEAAGGSGGDSKMYSTEAKGGMASLGELMNLKRGGDGGEENAKPEQPKLSKKERRAQRALEKSAQEDEAAEIAENQLSEDAVTSQTTDAETGATEDTATGAASSETENNQTETLVDENNASGETDSTPEMNQENSAPETTGDAAAAPDTSEESAASSEETNAATDETPQASSGGEAENSGGDNAAANTNTEETAPNAATDDASTESTETESESSASENAPVENSAVETAPESNEAAAPTDASNANDNAEEKSANS